MAKTTCIPKEIVDEIRKIDFTSDTATREQQLRDILGNDGLAKDVNELYERSLTLKNQDIAFDNFIKKLGTDYDKKIQEKVKKTVEEARRKKEVIQKLDLLNLVNKEIRKKYNIDIDYASVQKINNLNKESKALKEAMQGTPVDSKERIAYGLKQVELSDYINNLKNPEISIKQKFNDFKDRVKNQKGVLGKTGEVLRTGVKTITDPAAKSLAASLDASFAFRQGLKVLASNKSAWSQGMKDAFMAFKNISSKADIKKASDLFKAKLVSDPLYEEALKSKLAIGVIEDFFPTSIGDKIPGLNNIFQASNDAFTMFSQGARFNLFKDMYTTAVQNGTEITPQLLKDFAYVANSISGRGSLGKAEPLSDSINRMFFSGRYIKSQLDTFTMPFNPKLSPEARQEAFKSSAKTLGLITALIGAASMFTDVETDPRSSKFGKARIGQSDKFVDLTGGLGSYITLAVKQLTGESKSANTGKITKLDSGKFGAQNRLDVLIDWTTNKLSPVPSTAVQYLKGRDYTGNKPTIGTSALNLVSPISAKNAVQTFAGDDAFYEKLVSSIADLSGASVTDYGKFK